LALLAVPTAIRAAIHLMGRVVSHLSLAAIASLLGPLLGRETKSGLVQFNRHQTIGLHLPAGFLACLGQGLEKILPVYVIDVNVLLVVAPIHDTLSLKDSFTSQQFYNGSTSHRLAGRNQREDGSGRSRRPLVSQLDIRKQNKR
jgi:hypothetical protein